MKICRTCKKRIDVKKPYYLIYGDFAYCCKSCAKIAGFEVSEEDKVTNE